MREQIKNMVTIGVLGGFLVFMLCLQVLRPSKEMSDTERRALKQMPEISVDSVQAGNFMTEFENYTQDQFPFRDAFRGIKAFSVLYLFGQKEVNDLYVQDGYVAKVEYPKVDSMLEHATERFHFVYEKFLKDTQVNIYSSIVPDKNYFLAEKSGHIALDYDGFIKEFQDKTPYMQYLPIKDLLHIEDYYKTDTHWRQERLQPIAESLCAGMGNSLPAIEYEVKKYEKPFYGVYAGQISLSLPADDLYYLTNSVLEQCKVTSFDTGKAKESFLYDFKKADGKDPYELFLSGSDALLVVENPNATTDKELVVFRDSFGSSLIPLMVPGYKKVTVVDLRYVQSQMLGYFITFDHQDVLFLYSALVLNNSLSLK